MKLIKVNVLKEWVENWFTKNRFYHPYAKNNNIPITELYDILEQMPSAQPDVPDINVGDMVSRQAAIDAPEKLIKDCNPDHFVGHQKFIEFMDNDEIGSFGNWQFANGFNLGLTAVEVEIEKLLSAQPKWISVTERLPEIDMSHPHHKDYLVQYDSGGIDVASWSNVNRFWTDHVTEPHWNCVQFAKVIAWMPLPEPWKGEEK